MLESTTTVPIRNSERMTKNAIINFLERDPECCVVRMLNDIVRVRLRGGGGRGLGKG